MSTQNPGGDEAGTGEKQKTLTKFRRRVSKILGRDDGRRMSTVAEPSASTAGPPAVTSAPTKPEPVAKGDAPKPLAPGTSYKAPTAKSAAEHAKIQEEKARAMFAKYSITLDIGEWAPTLKADIPRVEKKVRMRIHRTCHRCQTQFGADRKCSNCTHQRCKKCPGYPAKKGAQKSRRVCHKCQTPFKSKTAVCETCTHERCPQCPREPVKAPPGSETIKKWTCHECQNVHRDPENPCLKCGHSKCDQCKLETAIRKLPGLAGDGGGTAEATDSKNEPGNIQNVEEGMKKMHVKPAQGQASSAA